MVSSHPHVCSMNCECGRLRKEAEDENESLAHEEHEGYTSSETSALLQTGCLCSGIGEPDLSGVTYAENLCAAWLEFAEKGWKAKFREGLMQSLYELGVEEWLDKAVESEKLERPVLIGRTAGKHERFMELGAATLKAYEKHKGLLK